MITQKKHLKLIVDDLKLLYQKNLVYQNALSEGINKALLLVINDCEEELLSEHISTLALLNKVTSYIDKYSNSKNTNDAYLLKGFKIAKNYF